MLAQRGRPLCLLSEVVVVLVALGNNDLVHGHLGTASAHALVHVIVLLVPRHAWSTIGKVGEHI